MLFIRKAIAADAPLIVEMIRELAEFERELDQVEITAADLIRDGFGTQPRFTLLWPSGTVNRRLTRCISSPIRRGRGAPACSLDRKSVV